MRSVLRSAWVDGGMCPTGSSWSDGGGTQHSRSSWARVRGVKRSKQLWNDLHSLVAEKGPELELKGWESMSIAWGDFLEKGLGQI